MRVSEIKFAKLESLYPYKKIGEGKYIFFNEAKNIPRLTLNQLGVIFNYLLWIAILPFLIIYEIYRLIRIFLPTYIKTSGKEPKLIQSDFKKLEFDKINWDEWRG